MGKNCLYFCPKTSPILLFLENINHLLLRGEIRSYPCTYRRYEYVRMFVGDKLSKTSTKRTQDKWGRDRRKKVFTTFVTGHKMTKMFKPGGKTMF